QQGRRALRADLQDERGVRRSAGAAPRRFGRGEPPQGRQVQDPQPAGEALAHAGGDQDRHAGARRAYRRDPEGSRVRRKADQGSASEGRDLVAERLLGKKDGAIGWVVFNNPERRNAVSIDMWEAIPTVLEGFAKDAEIRVVVLAGAGDKAFVAGADISQFEKQRSSEADVRRYEEIGE